MWRTLCSAEFLYLSMPDVSKKGMVIIMNGIRNLFMRNAYRIKDIEGYDTIIDELEGRRYYHF